MSTATSSFNEQWQELLRKGHAWFMQREPRERVILATVAVIVGLLLIYALLFAPLGHAVDARTARIQKKQQDLAYMQSMAPQVAALGASAAPPAANGESLVVLIANAASSGNVAAALTSQTPEGPDSVRVRFEGVSFDDLVLWLGVLQHDYGIRTTNADINRTPQSGLVTASLTLQRGS